MPPITQRPGPVTAPQPATAHAPARRSLWAAASLSVGLWLGAPSPLGPIGTIPPWAGLAMSVIAGLLAALPGRAAPRRRAALLLCAAIGLGAGWSALRLGDPPERHVFWSLSDEARLVRVEGLVLDTPRTDDRVPGRLGAFVRYEPSTRLELSVRRVQRPDGSWRASSGRVRVRVSPALAQPPPAGSLVRVTGLGSRLAGASNPGVSDARLWGLSRGIGGELRVESGAGVEPAAAPGASPDGLGARLVGLRAVVRERARGWLERAVPEPGAPGSLAEGRSLVRAMLLGEREPGLADLGESFTRLGITHVLAISGLNLVLLAWALLLGLRLIPGASERPWIEFAIVGAGVGVYLSVIPAESPVLRAAVMVMGALVAETAGRRYDRLTVLGWAMVLVLLLQPRELWSAGFQLSFGVVGALLTLATPLRERLFGPVPEAGTTSAARALLERAKDGAAASVCAWAVAAPLVAYHVGVFSPLGALATFVLSPLVGLVMVVGYLALVGAFVSPSIGHAVEPALGALGRALAWSARVLDTGSWAAVWLPQISAALTLVLTGVVAWWMLGARARSRAAWCLTIAACAWLGAEFWSPWRSVDEGVRIDSLNVGDGACHLVRAGGEALLFDCGSLRLTIGERVVPRAVRALGAARVGTLVLSHPNIDHYSGVLDVVAPLGVRRVVVGEAFVRAAQLRPDGPASFVLSGLRERGVRIEEVAAGDHITLGARRALVLSPPRGARWRSDNDASLVLAFPAAVQSAAPGRGDASAPLDALFCGDIGPEAILALMSREPGLRARWLEAPHHGSINDPARQFIEQAAAGLVVQSTGARRAGDERWDDLKARLSWRVTSIDGAVSWTIDERGRARVRTWGRSHGTGWRDLPAGQ